MGASVDTAALALTFDTGGMARGERQAAVLTDKIQSYFEKLERKAQQMNRAINQAFNFSGGNSGSATNSALARIEADFARHNQRIVEGASKTANRVQEIEAKNIAAINLQREKAAQKNLEINKKIEAQTLASAARLEQVQAASAARVAAAEQRRLQNRETVQGRIRQQAEANAVRIEAVEKQAAARLQEIEHKRQAAIDLSRERFAQREFERQRRQAERANQGGRFGSFLRNSSLIRESGESIGNTGIGLTLLTDKFLALGRAAVQSAVDIDKNVNTLRAFLGSSEAAEKRLTQLINLSQKTPGLTSGLATTLDAQLRTSNVSQGTIDKILPSIGRLNAVSPLGDPAKFAQNLQQLVTQGFERTDLKELVGQSPIAGQILADVFKVDSPTNSKAIRESAKKLGIVTVEDLFKAFAEAAGRNRALAGVTESLASRFEKIRDRVSIAFRPLGLSIVKALEPLVEKAVPLIERLSKAFDELPDSTKTAIIAIAGIAAALGPALIVIGGFIQSLGALGDLYKATAKIFKAAPLATAIAEGATAGGGAAGAGVALGTIAATIGIVVVAVAGLAVAWKTNFGGIRDITRDVINEVVGLFGELRQFWAENAEDIKAIGKVAFDGLTAIFRGWESVVGPLWRNTWEFIKTTIREALDFIKPAVTSTLSLLRGDFEGFKRDSARFWQETWDFILLLPARAFSSLLKIVEDGLTQLLTTTGFAKSIGLQIGDALGEGLVDGFLRIASSPSTAALIRVTLNRIRGADESRSNARAEARAASIGKGLDGEEITQTQLEENRAFLLKPKPKPTGTGFGDKGKDKEGAARQLRAAEEELAKATAKARLDIEENTLRKLIELEKDSFDKRLISADSYYDQLIKRELELLDIETKRIRGEAAASTNRLLQTKNGSPEELRELAQLAGLQSQLKIVESNRTETVRKLNDELLKNKTVEAERRREVIASGGSLGFEANKKFLDKFFGKQNAERDKPESQLRIRETEIQALGNAGLLREQQVTDALILTRRAYREELIKSAEARKLEAAIAADLDGKFFDGSRFDEEIAGLKTLGSELTRAEALQKRFAEQGVLDYSRLNESVEDLLASQKGLTETFSDFRANLVRDQFDLIDSGVDKLTKRLGVLGSAIGTLLKDLAKLALSKIAQRLFGLSTGQQPSFGAGQAAGAGFNPISLITGGGGGGIPGFSGASSGGSSGFGSVATGGFSGGNPVQQILGGGGSGGGSPVGGLLSKIPGIGKLFGASGASGNPGGVPIFTQGGGGSVGIAGGAAPSAFGGLAAGGLLAGGGILGSLAGGNSQIGKLLGGVGGTLLGGALGASGLLGGGIAGALPALFSNPITAIIGGALIGGALLARWIGGREQRKFRKTVESEYQIKVDGKQQGTALYKSVKELGETEFGKGKFGKMMVETIRLKKAQEMLAQYAEATGQENNPLARKFRDKVELTDPTDPRNRFTRRAYGGPVEANRPYIVGDAGRPEVFASRVPGEIFPSIKNFEKQLLIALQSSQMLGGIFAGAKQGLIAQLQTRAVAGESSSGVPSEFHGALKMIMAVNVRLTEALNRFESMPPEQVVATGARRAPEVIAEANLTSMRRNSPAGVAQKNEVFKGR